MAERLKALSWNGSVGQPTASSNLALSAKHYSNRHKYLLIVDTFASGERRLARRVHIPKICGSIPHLATKQFGLASVGALGIPEYTGEAGERLSPSAKYEQTRGDKPYSRGHSSAGRALALQARCRRFEPDWLHQIHSPAVLPVVTKGR